MNALRSSWKAAAVGLAVAVSLGSLAGCGTSHQPDAAKKTSATSVPVIKAGTKPHDVSLTVACTQAIAPVEAMIHGMHSGAVRTPAENKVLNRALLVAPRACSTSAEISKGQVSAQYRAWQYQDLLPWMQMPPTHQVVAAALSTTQPIHRSKR
jgi:hypothetical protein